MMAGFTRAASVAAGTGAEVDLGHALHLRRCLEVWIFLEPEQTRRQVAGELPPRRVVLADAVVVPHPLRRKAVFGACQLVLEAHELGVRLQLRIVLRDDEQAAEGARLRVGSRNLVLGRLRSRQLGPCVGDVLIDGLLLLGVALDGRDQIRDEVVAPLQLVLDLAPLRLDGLFLRRELVVRAARAGDGASADERQRQPSRRTTPGASRHELLLETLYICPSPAAGGAAAAAATAAKTPEAAAEASAEPPARTAAKPPSQSANERTDAAAPSAPRAAPESTRTAAAAPHPGDDEHDDEQHDEGQERRDP